MRSIVGRVRKQGQYFVVSYKLLALKPSGIGTSFATSIWNCFRRFLHSRVPCQCSVCQVLADSPDFHRFFALVGWFFRAL